MYSRLGAPSIRRCTWQQTCGWKEMIPRLGAPPVLVWRANQAWLGVWGPGDLHQQGAWREHDRALVRLRPVDWQPHRHRRGTGRGEYEITSSAEELCLGLSQEFAKIPSSKIFGKKVLQYKTDHWFSARGVAVQKAFNTKKSNDLLKFKDGTGPTLDKLVPLLEQGGYHYHIWGGL